MSVRYVNSIGNIINFTSWPLMILEPEKLLRNEWSYSVVSSGKINNFIKDLTSRDISVQIFADSEKEYHEILNDFTRITEIDIRNETPGHLEIDDYYLPCYVTAWEYEEYEENFYTTNKKITVTAEEWSWYKISRKEFIHEDIPDTSGRGYPYGYGYDYSMGSGYINYLNNEHFAPCDFIMKISGYAYEPSITIREHIYRVNETVLANEILTIDSKKKTIILTKSNGVEVNLFSKRDKSSYIFEKIPSGESQLYWNSGFNFEITLYEERSEPKWI